MGYSVTSAPGSKAWDETYFKTHLKVEDTAEDSLIAGYADGAQEWIEQYCGLKMIRQTVRETFTGFNRIIPLGVGPIDALVAVEYKLDNVWTAIPIADFSVDFGFAEECIQLLPAKTAPSPDKVVNNVRVQYTVGYTDAAAVPQPLKDAIYLRATARYTHRADFSKKYHDASISLIRPYKRW